MSLGDGNPLQYSCQGQRSLVGYSIYTDAYTCMHTHTHTRTNTGISFPNLKARGKFGVRLIELKLQDSSVMGPP